MKTILKEILESNGQYVSEFGSNADLPAPPRKQLAILTCMDARLDPFGYAGLTVGDAHVIRNAGGRATDDAIRSLVISHKLQGTREWVVVHHTECGMETFTNDIMAELLNSSLHQADLTPQGWRDSGEGPGSSEAQFMNWHTISNQEESVVADVRRIREHPLVSPTVSIHGFIFDVKTGKLIEVPEASRIGQPTAERQNS
jgi:carbonic anhydrase